MDSYGGGTGTVVANTTVLAAVATPKMNLAPTSLHLHYQIGGSTPASQNHRGIKQHEYSHQLHCNGRPQRG